MKARRREGSFLFGPKDHRDSIMIEASSREQAEDHPNKASRLPAFM
jgi:hypothetical protein